ncbi:16S rRNA (cytosine(967)-C(5))-methyltransferase RsmB [Bacillus shivajii]|uniref:16S rRNA (cytosine(967)-C(5))-methyltransferase RsmB n=1 Tax=Bacillus shivajii TaxID=1983719 RepID=UPI001CFA251B|nr:16S rRNA (cytosine(967)-C(5))-methyltransferase RsmB [Bacillus shivajii]UCZ51784.1 16S rRNA (cytosine(967)-C(5))-methyltransferase RsmB [Bacillus shivajii]
MKQQMNVREVALETLLRIEKNQAYSHLLLNEMIKKAKLNDKDVPLLTEIVYGTIQRQKTLDFYLEPLSKKPLQKLDNWVHILLRLSLYQMIYLDRVPDHAVINEAVQIAKKRGHKGISGMVNGILRAVQRKGTRSFDTIDDKFEKVAVKSSHPAWLIKRWSGQYGLEKTEQMAISNLLHPKTTARVNVSKVNVDQVLHSLNEEGIEAQNSDLLPESIVVQKGSLSKTKAFQEGWLTIQDEGSMLVANALGVKVNEQILDACAAPGGKTTHIAEKLKNTGQVQALDIHDHKIKLIMDQVNRLHLTNVEAEVLDARKVDTKFNEESFDRILVDAPCSGLGVIQRKPDIKWSKKADDVNHLATIQQDILRSVWPLLKKGGTLVYSTCTVDKEENEQNVYRFIESVQEATLDETFIERMPDKVKDSVADNKAMIQLFPGDYGTDGFFISALKKI